MFRFKHLVIVLCLTVVGFVSWRTYNYFFDMSIPTVTLEGIEEGGYCTGNVSCVLRGSDDYKVHDITIILDGNKELLRRYKIKKRSFEYQFTLPTTTLNQGKHTLSYTVTDASRHENSMSKTVSFVVDNATLQVALISHTDDLKVFQGRALHIQLQANKPLKKAVCKALSAEYACYPEAQNSLIYDCYIPVRIEQTPSEYVVTIDIVDFVGNTITLEQKFQVIAFPFKSQSLRLPQEKTHREGELGAPEQQFEADMTMATQKSPATKLWSGVFYVPCESRGITTDFGTLRVTQYKGKYSHNAVDLSAAPKSIVWAAQDGIIAIKARYAHAGNTVVIDHGYGLLSCYFHLDSFADNLNVGDPIKKGRPIGTLGMTGYATGYHLHWEMRLNNVQIDPMQWTTNIP